MAKIGDQVYEKPHPYGGKPPEIGWIAGQYTHLRTLYAQRNSEYGILRNAFDGNFGGAPDKLDTTRLKRDRVSLVYNLVNATTRRYMDSASASPRVDGVPRGWDDGDLELADKQAKYIDEVWSENKMSIQLIEASYCQSLLDRAIFSVRPAPWMKYGIKIDHAVPDFFFPITVGDNWRDPAAVIYGFRSFDDCDISADPMKFTDSQVFSNVIEYWDPVWFIRIEKAGVTMIKHDLGHIPWHVAHNLPVPHRYRGQGDNDQSVHLNEYLNMLMSAMGDMIAYAAAPIAIVRGTKMGGTNLPFEPRAVWELERDAQVGFLQWSGTPPAVEAQILRTIQANEDVTGTNSSVFGRDVPSGTSDKAIRSLTAGFSSRIGTKQTCMGEALAGVNMSILAWAEKLYGKREFQIIGEVSRPGKDLGKKKTYTFKGEESDGWYKTKLVFPPQDPSASYFQEMDKMDKKIQSRYSTMKNIGIRNVWDEREMIKAESLADAETANNMGLAQTGQFVHPDTMAANQEADQLATQKLLEQIKGVGTPNPSTTKQQEALARPLGKTPPGEATPGGEVQPQGPGALVNAKMTVEDVLARLKSQQAAIGQRVNGRVILSGALAKDGSADAGAIQLENPQDEGLIRQALGELGSRFTFTRIQDPMRQDGPDAITVFPGSQKKNLATLRKVDQVLHVIVMGVDKTNNQALVYNVGVLDARGQAMPIGKTDPQRRQIAEQGEMIAVHIDGINRRDDGGAKFSLLSPKVVRAPGGIAKPNSIDDVAKMWEKA